jgi:hypothetical protein
MDRREALRRVAFVMGGSLTTPALISLLEGCEPKTKEASVADSFTPDLQKLVAEVAETIIPTTSTPGAKEAKVDQFIVTMINDCYPEEDRKHFFAGLNQLDESAKKAYSHSFAECKDTERVDVLKKFEAEAFTQRDQKRKEDEANKGKTKAKEAKAEAPHVYFMLKELTLLGYFTSEPGATKALEYVPVPGRYEPCIPLKEGQKAWAI